MAWTNSKIFAAFISNALDRTNVFSVTADTIKAALYNNTGTPDNTVAASGTAYSAAQWVTGNEVFQAAHWTQGGIAITAKSAAFATTTITYSGANCASLDSATTLANVYGTLVYDDTLTTPVAKQGMSYNYFGGVQSVTSGSFTIVWNGSGIFTISVA